MKSFFKWSGAIIFFPFWVAFIAPAINELIWVYGNSSLGIVLISIIQSAVSAICAMPIVYLWAKRKNE